MSHYYTREGNAQHTQPTKPGAKNPFRDTTIADARKLGLLPSVSGITDIVSKPALASYIGRGIANACFDRPPHPGEERSGYIKAMIEAGASEGKQAAQVGTDIHACIEKLLTGEEVDTSLPITLASGITLSIGEMVFPAISKMKAMGLEIQHSEKVLVNRYLGYAGTTDVIFKAADSYGVLDFKSRKTKAGEAVEPYDTQPAQIAAYIAAHWQTSAEVVPFGSKVRGINLYISTPEPGRVEVVEYDSERLIKEWEAFKNMMALWIWQQNYNPAF